MKNILLSVAFVMFAANAGGQSMDQEIAALGGRISKSLAEKHFKSAASVDFKDLQGIPTELGRFLADQLTVEMVSAGGVSMVTRAHLQSILTEHQLTVDGLVKPENAKKLGEFAGVDVLLNGVITALDERIVLTVQAVSTDSAKVVAAGRISFPKTSEIVQLLNRSVSSPPNAATSIDAGTATNGRGAQRATDAMVITSKEFGSLRINLKSLFPIRFKDLQGDTYNGIRCTFEFINRETQRNIQAAAIADAGNDGRIRVGGASSVGSAPGQVLRVSLVDDRGVTWRVFSRYVRGLSIVSPGWNADLQPFSPNDIATLLRRAESFGTNVSKDRNGDAYPFIWGELTPISAGGVTTVTLDFVQDPPNNVTSAYPSSIQFSGEFALGAPNRTGVNTYSIINLLLDRVELPKKQQ